MEKEKIIVSACLLGINCKYNGDNNKNENVLDYLKNKEVIPVCPEIYGGLSIPRTTSEIIGDKVITKDKRNVTKEYLKGAEETLYIAKLFNVKKALLKAKSPSCGNKEIYDGTFTGNKIKGIGITAKLLKENGLEIINENEI